MEKGLIAVLLGLPAVIIAWIVKGIVEDAEQQVAVTTASAVSPSFGGLLSIFLLIVGILGTITFFLAILAKFGIR